MKVLFAKLLSKASPITIWIVFILVISLIALVPIIPNQSSVARFLADLFSPTSLRNIAYDGMCDNNIGWGSVIAYVIGIVLILGVFVPVVTNRMKTLGERYLNGTLARYHWRKHALFIGYDELMIGTLKQARKDYKKVVVAISGDVPQIREQLSRLLSNEMEKIEIIQCGQDSISDLKKRACFLKAKKIFIIGFPENPTHDAYNLRTLAIIAKAWKEKGIGKNYEKPKDIRHIMAYLRNQSTFSLLQRQGFSAENIWGIIGCSFSTKDEKEEAQKFVDCHCEYFNFYCDKALRMLSSSPENSGMSLIWHSEEKNIANPNMENRQVHLVVLGMTQMGTALVRELLRLAHPSGKGTKMLVTMVDQNACEEMHYFIGRTKELFKLCHYTYYDYNISENKISQNTIDEDFLDVEFEFVQCDVAHPHLTEQLLKWSVDENQLLTLVICTNDSPKNMAVAMYLPPEMFCGENAVPTWVYQEGDDSVRHLLNSEKYPHIHPFSFADHTVASTANSPIYEWDRSVVKYYEEHYKTNKVAEQWENKSQDKRWSSLYNIKSIGIKLRAVGVLDVTQDIEESKKLMIDKYEHNRWVVERLTMGSRPTNAEQHALVVEELKQQLEKHPDWRPKDDSHSEKIRSAEVCKEIDNCRIEFKKLKNGEGENAKGIIVHDDIRPFEDLDDFTKYKDRKTLDDYIESIRKNPKKD